MFEASILDFQKKSIVIPVYGVGEASCPDPTAATAKFKARVRQNIPCFFQVGYPASQMMEWPAPGRPDAAGPIFDQFYHRGARRKGNV